MVFAGYGRCMGGECVVFAGWPAYGGRAFAEASRGRCVVFAGYGRCMGGECVVFAGYGHCMGGNAWYLRGGRPILGSVAVLLKHYGTYAHYTEFVSIKEVLSRTL